jgi:hypothetical protein
MCYYSEIRPRREQFQRVTYFFVSFAAYQCFGDARGNFGHPIHSPEGSDSQHVHDRSLVPHGHLSEFGSRPRNRGQVRQVHLDSKQRVFFLPDYNGCECVNFFQTTHFSFIHFNRYLFLNCIANQLRYPNSHTHYFSCTLLYLFAEANTEAIQEQITRVLLERLIVNRPHPWGLLITFIELIKNPTFQFWQHEFVTCAPEIQKLFESVARSCMVHTLPNHQPQLQQQQQPQQQQATNPQE